MILSAAASIEIHKQQINELNVFPVPDGDTGTNMSMTLNAAAADLRKAGSVTLTKAADITASAMLRGARGNSGVILSLLFRGFSKALKGVEACTTASSWPMALRGGVEAAYKAVMKPTEGTILTVSRLAADARHGNGRQRTTDLRSRPGSDGPICAARRRWRRPSNHEPRAARRRASWTQAARAACMILEGMLACAAAARPMPRGR